MPNAEPIDVLVAGWFPAIDDIAAGRFVADQLAALRATGRVRPRVIAWENIPVFGDAALRSRQAAAVTTILAHGRAAHQDPFSDRGAFGPQGVPVARLAAIAGETPGTGPGHRVEHRWAALEPVLDAIASPLPALVHGHAGYPAGAVAARATERLGVPFVLTEHATYLGDLLADAETATVYAETVRRARRVIAVSTMLAGQVTRAVPDAAARVVVIPNGIAMDDFRIPRPDDRDASELLYVGYRRAHKGIATLLAAFRLARVTYPELTLRLIGRSATDEEEAGWIRLAAELGISRAVRFEPPADRRGVAEAMGRAALFVHPSTNETFGVVAAEALAAGLPVVATDSGGIRDVLGDDPERLGALVPHSDVDALAAAIVSTLERRRAIDPEALRDHVARRFGLQSVAGRLVDLYDEVLAEEDRGRSGTPGPRRPPGAGTGAWDADAAPTSATLPSEVVLVGFVRPHLDRLVASLPPALRARLTVITTGERPGPDGVHRLIHARAGTGAELARLLRWGVARRSGVAGSLRSLVGGTLRRVRGDRARQEARVLTELRRTILEGLPDRGEAPLVIAVGAIDHLALEGIPGDRFVAGAGAIGWLGDRWWASLPDGQDSLAGGVGVDAGGTAARSFPAGSSPSASSDA